MATVSSLSATPASLLDAALDRLGFANSEGLPLVADAARRFSAEFAGELNTLLFNLSLSELRELAASRAQRYLMLARDVDAAAAIRLATIEYGKQIPGTAPEFQLSRVIDSSFWIRFYMRKGKRAHELAYMRAGFVSASRERYASDATVKLFRKYREDQEKYLKSHYIIDRRPNKMGQHTRRALFDVVKSDASRKAKLWAFLAGIEELSVEAGLDCALLTLTLPAVFHVNPKHGKNTWNGADPRAGNKMLAELWNKFQRDLNNEKIAVSGARFVENHQDGTPHWHVWLHYQAVQLPAILRVLSRYFPGDASRRVAAIRVRDVVEDGAGPLYNKKNGSRFSERFFAFDSASNSLSERPARFNAQCDLSIINREYANGATYASKYAMKTLEKDDVSERVAAARWIWGMRGFQLFGINRCLTAWDELFRAKEVPVNPAARALYSAVHAGPGRHERLILNPLTGVREKEEYEGGTAPFIRLLGGLSAARGAVYLRMKSLRVRLTYVERLSRYGDMSRVKTGLMILRGREEWLHSATTREPGRFVICREDFDEGGKSLSRVDVYIKNMAPYLE